MDQIILLDKRFLPEHPEKKGCYQIYGLDVSHDLAKEQQYLFALKEEERYVFYVRVEPNVAKPCYKFGGGVTYEQTKVLAYFSDMLFDLYNPASLRFALSEAETRYGVDSVAMRKILQQTISDQTVLKPEETEKLLQFFGTDSLAEDSSLAWYTERIIKHYEAMRKKLLWKCGFYIQNVFSDIAKLPRDEAIKWYSEYLGKYGMNIRQYFCGR